MIKSVLTEALKWESYKEKKRPTKPYTDKDLLSYDGNAGTGNYTIFAKWYKEFFGEDYQAQPWCAMFVSTVFYKALGKDVQKDLMPHFASCRLGVEQFKKMGLFTTGKPQKGYVIFFKGSNGVANHVGIVTDVDDKYVYTVEGNTNPSSGVVPNGGQVAKKKYLLTEARILGYGTPRYRVIPTKLIAKSTYPKDLPLKEGSRGESVKKVQKALGIKEDGIFGGHTKICVINFQKKEKMHVDAIVGKLTWSALGL